MDPIRIAHDRPDRSSRAPAAVRRLAVAGPRLLGTLALLVLATAAEARAQGGARCLRIDIYTRPDSEQSANATKFLDALQARRPGVHVRNYNVSEDLDARKRLYDLASRSGQKVALPAVYSGGQLIIGYRDAATTGRQIEGTLTFEAFVREGCPRCAEAKPYLYGLRSRYPGLALQVREVTTDPGARTRMEELARYHGVPASFPTVHAGGRLIVGWNGLSITGSEIETLLHSVSEPCAGHDRQAVRPVGPSSMNARPASPIGVESLALVLVGLQVPAADDLPDEFDLPAEADLHPEAAPSGASPPPLPPADAGIPPGPDLPAEADLPPPPLLEEGALPPVAVVGPGAHHGPGRSPPPDAVRVPLLGKLNVRELGLPAFTFLIGLVDGFNPCAMWVLIFLLTVLVSLNDRRKLVLVAGTFVLVSGLAYFAFMAAWLNVFMLIGFARWAQILLGTLAVTIGVINVKDFFAFKKGISLSIPESAKPKIYEYVWRIVTAKNLTGALVGAVTLAVLVNTVELLCTAGLPAIYTQILMYQDFPAWKNYAYLGLYISAYMLDDAALLTVIVVTLSRRRLQEKEGRYLKLLSGATILALGAVMLLKPEWLV